MDTPAGMTGLPREDVWHGDAEKGWTAEPLDDRLAGQTGRGKNGIKDSGLLLPAASLIGSAVYVDDLLFGSHGHSTSYGNRIYELTAHPSVTFFMS